MNKLRSDSAFCQLTPQKSDTLEGWLFEERLSYPKVLERLKAEFGVETSLTGVRRIYKRLDVERSAQSLMDAAEMSGLTVQALKSGELKPAMLLFANKCLFELLRQEPVPIKEVTTLLRAITSAESHAMRREIRDQDEAERRESERVRKVEAEWRQARRDIEREDKELRRERAARRKARLEAVENVAEEARAKTKMSVECSPSPQPSPPGEGEESARRLVHSGDAGGSASGNFASEEGEMASAVVAGDARGKGQVAELGARCCGSQTRGPGDGAWRPSVVEGEEDRMAEAAENRLAPLNAA